MFQAAVETDFPTVRIRGCYFHFSKAILSKIKDLGLFTPYKNDRRLNQFIRKFIAIGFLPVFYVRQKFHQVLQEASTRLLVCRFTNLSVFLNYFEATWLHQFPPNIYNVYARQSTLRTINACEGYKNRLNTRVGRRIHPNFWVFVKSLQNEENLARRSYRRFQLGYQADIPQRKKWRNLNAMICNVKQRFEMQSLDTDEYWDSISEICQNL